MTAVVEFQGLRKRFGALLAVDDLTFGVRPGEVVGFLGPNGAGKTTTLRMLLGLARPTAGTATIRGQTYRELRNPLRAVGVVLEGAGAHPGRTARNHLRVQAVASGSPATRVDEMLDLVGLTSAADRRVGAFSLGMRQRLGLAAALLPDPDILILDEPANGLDPQGVRWLRDLLRAQAAQGRTVLVSSHVLAEVAQSADSVVIINRGRLATQAPLDQVLTSAGSKTLEEAFMRLTNARPDSDGSALTAGAAGAVSAPGPEPARSRPRTLAPVVASAFLVAFLVGWMVGRRWS